MQVHSLTNLLFFMGKRVSLRIVGVNGTKKFAGTFSTQLGHFGRPSSLFGQPGLNLHIEKSGQPGNFTLVKSDFEEEDKRIYVIELPPL